MHTYYADPELHNTRATYKHTPLTAHWDTWSRGRWAPGQGSGSSSQAGQSGWPCPAVSSPGWEGHRNAGRQTPAGSEANGLPAGSWRGPLMPDIAWTDRKGQSEKEWETSKPDRQEGRQEGEKRGKKRQDNIDNGIPILYHKPVAFYEFGIHFHVLNDEASRISITNELK